MAAPARPGRLDLPDGQVHLTARVSRSSSSTSIIPCSGSRFRVGLAAARLHRAVSRPIVPPVDPPADRPADRSAIDRPYRGQVPAIRLTERRPGASILPQPRRRSLDHDDRRITRCCCSSATILGSCLGSFLNVCVLPDPPGDERPSSAFAMPGMRRRDPRPRQCPGPGLAVLVRPMPRMPRARSLRATRGRAGGRPALRPALPLAVALAAGDPWERIGPGRLLGILLASWVVTVLGAFAILVGRDLRPSFGLDWRGGSVGRQRDAKARHPSPLVHEEVAVELDDLVRAVGDPPADRVRCCEPSHCDGRHGRSSGGVATDGRRLAGMVIHPS